MSKISSEKILNLVPPQTPGVPRLADAGGWQGDGGVEASGVCSKLRGPARSLCFAMKHGISI
jgi:hypothetical protein